MSTSYIKQQLMSVDGSKVIYPQTKAEIVWREDLSSTVESSLKTLENAIGLGDIQGRIENISASGAAPLILSASKDDTNVTITGSVAVATQNTAGIMSAEDKTKLDGISNSADSVSFTRDLTSGTKIGTITINGTGTDLYCQTSTSGSDTTNVIAGNGLTGGGSADSSTGVTLNLATSGVTAGTYGPSAAITGSNGATMNVPQITVDTYGRVTSIINRVYTAQNTDTKNTTGTTNSTSILYLAGATSQAANPQTYSHSAIKANCNASGTNEAGSLTATKVYGAVWNDYAECRAQKEEIRPGYCVASGDDGKVYKTNEKFQACDGIVSDTFGFSIGETDECKTPLAVAGRVLAYAENPEELHSGDTVCAGPNGKVIKMTREEIREWPDRIVGIISEIPTYETWGTGNVKVDGRIWIKVK